jgi:hypothetical protein
MFPMEGKCFRSPGVRTEEYLDKLIKSNKGMEGRPGQSTDYTRVSLRRKTGLSIGY